VYGNWLKDEARRTNEVGVVKEEGSGYYVVQFLNRERRDNSYQTVDVNSIFVESETTTTTDEQGNSVQKPTDEQLAAAYEKTEGILAQWNAVTDPTTDAFLSLAAQDSKSGEPKSEALTEVARNTYGTDFDKWAFTPGLTSPGNTVIVEATDSSGAVIGYRIMYLKAFGQSRWEYSAVTALRNVDYQDWYTSLQDQYPITQEEGMKQVGVTR
jgi:hypothetical protein